MSRFEYNPEQRGGGRAWLAIGAFVVGYDVLSDETLSNAYSRAVNSERALVRDLTLGLTAITALHLLDRLGDIDPIDNMVEFVQDRYNSVQDWTVEGIKIP